MICPIFQLPFFGGFLATYWYVCESCNLSLPAMTLTPFGTLLDCTGCSVVPPCTCHNCTQLVRGPSGQSPPSKSLPKATRLYYPESSLVYKGLSRLPEYGFEYQTKDRNARVLWQGKAELDFRGRRVVHLMEGQFTPPGGGKTYTVGIGQEVRPPAEHTELPKTTDVHALAPYFVRTWFPVEGTPRAFAVLLGSGG